MARSIPLPPRYGPDLGAWAEAVQQPPGIRTVTADANATPADGAILGDATSAGITVTLPPAAMQPCCEITVKKIDASGNAVTIEGYAAETIDGAANKALAAQWKSLTMKSDGTAWYITASV